MASFMSRDGFGSKNQESQKKLRTYYAFSILICQIIKLNWKNNRRSTILKGKL